MNFDPLISNIKPVEPLINKPEAGGKVKKGEQGPGSFAEHFNQAIKEVDSLQKEADSQIEGMMLGKENSSPHSAMIALEKADMAFQMMNAVRTKIIRAYEEVIRTQV
ncbi:MAG: flagellar hook-basal body complex protein FliE [Deltaproteobacteria bacterium]|nr:flagellar hook-basal body complex protein FliE [Deltaproteobacteria bacterium]